MSNKKSNTKKQYRPKTSSTKMIASASTTNNKKPNAQGQKTANLQANAKNNAEISKSNAKNADFKQHETPSSNRVKTAENSVNREVKHQNQTNQKHIHTIQKMSSRELWAWGIIVIASCIVAGILATILGGDMKGFEAHTLPPLTPPTIVFPIVWAILYVTIGVAAFLVFTSPNQTTQNRRGDIIWFSINLLLNIIWPLFFYRLDMLVVATILCGLVFITAAITCFRFYYRNLTGGILYTIYTLWLLFAFYLNLGICLLNA